VIGTFALSGLVLEQNAEARMYGLFLGTCALGILVHAVTADRRQPSWRALAMTALAHAAIVSTRLCGLFFSVATLCATVVCDRRRGFWRPTLYGAILAVWLALLPYIPAFRPGRRNQPARLDPRALGARPDPDLRARLAVPDLIPLVAAAAILLRLDRTGSRLRAATGGVAGIHRIRTLRLELLTPGRHVAPGPAGVWVTSRTLTPIFVPRYLEPAMLAWAIVLTDLASRLRVRLMAAFSWPASPAPRRALGLAAVLTTGRPTRLLLKAMLLAPIPVRAQHVTAAGAARRCGYASRHSWTADHGSVLPPLPAARALRPGPAPVSVRAQ
jgi:hypothetical protein